MKQSKFDKQLDKLGYVKMVSITIPNSYCLYRKDNHHFVATFSLNGNKIVFNKKEFDNPEDFLKEVEEFNKTLYFPIDTYNPDYRKDFVDEIRLNNIFENCGLTPKRCGYSNYDSYALENNLGGKFVNIIGTDLILASYTWIPLKNDDDKIDDNTCEKIKSKIASIYAYHISTLVEALNKIGKLSYIDDIEIKKLDTSSMRVETMSGKEGIINKLEEVLEKLKENKNE